MVITAKYAGRCRICGGTIAAGESVEWSAVRGTAHAACVAAVAPVAVVVAPEPVAAGAEWWQEYELFDMATGMRAVTSGGPAAVALPKTVAPVAPAPPVVVPQLVRVRITLRPWIALEKGVGRTLDGVIVRESNAALQFTGATVAKGLVSCQVCGRPLTNGMSRRLGVGPICVEKFAGALLAQMRVASFEAMTDEQVAQIVDALEARTVDRTWFPKSQILACELLSEGGAPTGEEYEL